MRARLCLPVVLALVAGCGGEGTSGSGSPGGTVVIASFADADVLLPPLVRSVQGKEAIDQLFDKLAEIGPQLNIIGEAGFEPRLAESWTWAPDSMSLAFHMNPRAKWHDGTPVTARDVAFSWQLYMDPATASPVAPNLENIDSVTARDSATAVVWFKRRSPTQFYQATYELLVLPEHLLGKADRATLASSEFASHPIGTGRFRFGSWTKGTSLELVADTANYRGRPKIDRLIFSVSADPTAAQTKVFAGEADFVEQLRAENVDEVASHPTVTTVHMPVLQYGYAPFNVTRAPFKDPQLRRALTMAIDRQSIVKNIFDTLAVPALGPFARALPSADTTLHELPFDTTAADRLLDSLGWKDSNGDKVRDKGGKPLQIALLVPSSSKVRQRMAVLLQEQWARVGAKADIEPLEPNTLGARLAKRDYDASILLLAADPNPASLRQSWGTPGVAAGSNYSGYSNPKFDVLVDSALASSTPAASRQLFSRAYQTIVDDAPAVWLYEPRPLAAAHKRLHLAGMRADAWWAGIADWSIPANERIDRDKIGLRAAR